jgi:hypothetical protein
MNGHAAPQDDSAETDKLGPIKRVLMAYHEAAIGLPGVFVLTIIDPKTGTARPQLFAIGDVDGMAREAVARGEHSNVYFAPAVLRKDLARGQRGKAQDIVAVLGLPIDDDGDTGKRATLPPGIGPSIEITTCTNPAHNLHLHFVFARPLPLHEASVLAELLHCKCGEDYGTKDVAHIWRLPQTFNHPNELKVEKRGRPAKPQPVTLTGGSFELIDPDEFRRALEKMPDLDDACTAKSDGDGRPHKGDSTDRDEIIGRLPGWLIDLVESEPVLDRSGHCFHTMMALMEHGLTVEEVRLVAQDAPFARKYTARGDIDDEIKRVRAKWGGSAAGREQSIPSRRTGTADPRSWPIMESKATHGIVGEITRLATANSEVDPVAVIATILTWAAAEFGRGQFIFIGEEKHHSRHYVGIVAQSSRARKGTSKGPVKRLFEEADKIRRSASTLPFPSGSRLKVSNGPLSSGEGLVYAIRDKAEGDEEDAGVPDKRLLCIEGELGAALRAFQRSGNNLSMILRMAFDGETISPLIKNNRITASEPHVNLVAHITRHELKELLTATEIWSGFGNRFLWLLARRPKIVAFPTPMPAEEVTKIAIELARIINLAHERGANGGRELVMSNAAQDRWVNVYQSCSLNPNRHLSTKPGQAQSTSRSMRPARSGCSIVLAKSDSDWEGLAEPAIRYPRSHAT